MAALLALVAIPSKPSGARRSKCRSPRNQRRAPETGAAFSRRELMVRHLLWLLPRRSASSIAAERKSPPRKSAPATIAGQSNNDKRDPVGRRVRQRGSPQKASASVKRQRRPALHASPKPYVRSTKVRGRRSPRSGPRSSDTTARVQVQQMKLKIIGIRPLRVIHCRQVSLQDAAQRLAGKPHASPRPPRAPLLRNPFAKEADIFSPSEVGRRQRA